MVNEAGKWRNLNRWKALRRMWDSFIGWTLNGRIMRDVGIQAHTSAYRCIQVYTGVYCCIQVFDDYSFLVVKNF